MDDKSEGNNLWRDNENDPFTPVSGSPNTQPQNIAQPENSVNPQVETSTPQLAEQTATTPDAIEQPREPAQDAEPVDNKNITETSEADEKAHFEPIRWTASEAIEQERGKSWYVTSTAVAVVIVAALVALGIFHIVDMITTITTSILAVLILISLFVTAKSPVREVEYILTNSGLTINGKLHTFSEFRAFGVRQFDAMWQLILIPVKRFGMSTTIFIHEDQGEQIVDILGAVLPMEDIKVDMIDRITHKLKM